MFTQAPAALTIPTVGMMPQVFQAHEMLKDRNADTSAAMVQMQLSNMGQEVAKKVDSIKTELQTSLQSNQQEFKTQLQTEISSQVAEGIKHALQAYGSRQPPEPSAAPSTALEKADPPRFNIWGETVTPQDQSEWKKNQAEKWYDSSWKGQSWQKDESEWEDKSWKGQSWKKDQGWNKSQSWQKSDKDWHKSDKDWHKSDKDWHGSGKEWPKSDKTWKPQQGKTWPKEKPYATRGRGQSSRANWADDGTPYGAFEGDFDKDDTAEEDHGQSSKKHRKEKKPVPKKRTRQARTPSPSATGARSRRKPPAPADKRNAEEPRPAPEEWQSGDDTSLGVHDAWKLSCGQCCTFTYPVLDWSVCQMNELTAEGFNAKSTQKKVQMREDLDRKQFPALTKTEESTILSRRQHPHQWSFQTQQEQQVPGLYWRLFERVPVQQSCLTIRKTTCCWKQKDSVHCWLCNVAICNKCSQESPQHNLEFQRLQKTSWCSNCLIEAESTRKVKEVPEAVRSRCKNVKCTKLLYSSEPLEPESATCSEECFKAWQESKKEDSNAKEVLELVFKPLPNVDILTPFAEVGVVQGNWKHAGDYVQRVKAEDKEVDTAPFENHVQTRTVKGTEVWPLQRPATFFDMLMVDLTVDYKAST